MKQIFLFVICLNFVASVLAQDVEVVVKNIRNDRGELMIGIFNSEKTFTKTPWKGEISKAHAGVVKVLFKNIPAGEYAMSVIHDENSNRKIDTNFLGVPKEGFGFSNDVMGTFGPPSFDKAKITFPSSQPISITLKYL